MNNNLLEAVEAESAGGVVYRINGDTIELAIVKIVPAIRWQLPKGLIDPGETAEIAALREVSEEAGIAAEMVAPIGNIEYSFVAAYDSIRRPYHKTVHFFLMRYVSGDVNDHDDEVDEARWVKPAQALDMLSFENERGIVEKAWAMIREAAE